MESNFWEEQRMEDPLLKCHSEEVEKMELPDWVTDVECPFCKKKVEKRAIRNIQLCLNARNFGEVSVQVFCDDCKKMDTLYFRTKIDHIADFVGCLRGTYRMPSSPVLEEDMYKMNYNNILDIMMAKFKKEKKDDSV